MQHDTTTYNMTQQHATRWSNGANFFFTTNVVRCCMKSWDRLTGNAVNVSLKSLLPDKTKAYASSPVKAENACRQFSR